MAPREEKRKAREGRDWVMYFREKKRKEKKRKENVILGSAARSRTGVKMRGRKKKPQAWI